LALVDVVRVVQIMPRLGLTRGPPGRKPLDGMPHTAESPMIRIELRPRPQPLGSAAKVKCDLPWPVHAMLLPDGGGMPNKHDCAVSESPAVVEPMIEVNGPNMTKSDRSTTIHGSHH
jgi:hypothetical protein